MQRGYKATWVLTDFLLMENLYCRSTVIASKVKIGKSCAIKSVRFSSPGNFSANLGARMHLEIDILE